LKKNWQTSLHEKEEIKMALVELLIRIQTSEGEVSAKEEAEIEKMLSDMEEIVGKSSFELDECVWEEM